MWHVFTLQYMLMTRIQEELNDFMQFWNNHPIRTENNRSPMQLMIRKDRDKKSRIRVTVLPQRNNANLSGTLYDPLITIAHGANHGIQYISNSVGAAEYVASYASKAEEPDKRQMANIYAKKISYIEGLGTHVTDRQRFYAVGSAILGISPVGAVQACYALVGLKFVKSSRQVVNVNPLNRKSTIANLCIFTIVCMYFNEAENNIVDL